MALYSVDIEKVLLGEFWSNRYIVEAETLIDAHASALDIVALERAVHKTVVTFTKYRTSTTAEGDDLYFITALNSTGLDGSGGDWLPLFLVARVDFSTAGGGRPSRKYLRLPLGENEVTNNSIIPAVVANINGSYATPMAALGSYVDVDGQAFIAGSCNPFVGMRQLRRGSKRRALPIIP